MVPLFSLLALAPDAGATTVPGGVIGTTTWNLAGSPYVVQGDITIPAGATLTIEAGVEVRAASTDASASGFDASRVEIVVDGTLDVLGDAADRVWFGPDTSTSSSAWYGIVVGSGGRLDLTAADLQRSTYGVRSAGTLDLLDLSVSLGATSGLYLTGGTATVAGSRFTSSTYGVWATGGVTTDVLDTVVVDTTNHGVYVNTTGSTTTTLDRLTVHSVSGSGVYVNPSSGAPTVTVTNSVLSENGNYGVYKTGSGTTTVSYSDAWNNSFSNLAGVVQGAGNLATNPLYAAAPQDLALTSNSPARFAADDGGDIGALPYAGAPTVGLQGTLWVDTTLPAGVHSVAGDLTVPSGVTLTLQPGAVFEAATSDSMKANLDLNRVELRVAGTLFSVGTAANPVVMRSVGSSQTSWYGVHLLSTANTGLVQHTVIEEASYAVRYEATANNPIRDTVFQRNGTAGVYLTAGTLLMERDQITDSTYGVWVTGGSSPDIRTTVVEDTTNHGIYVNTTGSPTVDIDRVTVWSCSGSGVYVNPSSGAPVVNVIDSILSENGNYGVYKTGSGTTTVSYSNAWNNSFSNLAGVVQGAGNLSENPLFVAPGTDFELTGWSPGRFAGSTGGDIGAVAYDGVPTVGLQGTLWGGLTLTAAGSPYTLLGDITVPAGATLSIDPGVTVYAATSDSMKANVDLNRVELEVDGTIDAVGTPYEPIVLESTGSSFSSWYGVHLLGGASGELTNVSIAEASYGVRHSAAAGVPLAGVHVERSATAAVWVDAGSPAIDALTATDSTYGLWLTSSGAPTVTNCGIWDTTNHGVYVNTTGSPSISLVNCTVHSVSGSGVYVNPSSGAPTVTVTNALLTSNGNYGVYKTGSGTTTVSYSDAWNNSFSNLAGVVQGAGNLATNPFYVDEPARNLRLGPTSPAIDAGTASGAPDHDLAGRDRPVDGNGLGGAEYDMGAYEYRNEVPGITVTPAGTVLVSEAGTTATLGVVLDSAPLAQVTLAITGSDPTEGAVSPATLTFTPANWSTPRSITVTGVDDDLDDGQPAWSITLDPSGSTDLEYRILAPTVLSAQTTDDDTAGLALLDIATLRTTELGGTDTFTVALASQPTTDVRLDLSSSDAGEGTVSPPAISFTAANWDQPRTVTVTGVDDADADGDQTWSVRLDPSLSGDPAYAALAPVDVPVLNADDETAVPAISVLGGPLVTTEAGGTSTFAVVLDTAPSASVTIAVSSSEPSEATVSPASLTFTTSNWSVPQTVTATGVDDGEDDGDQPFVAVLDPAVSADPAFDGLDPDDVPGTNTDDDTAAVVLTAVNPTTSEAGGSDVIVIRLGSRPSADVTVTATSSDTGEGTVSGPLVFTSANYAANQAIVITGVDDAEVDGDQPYRVQLSVSSSDPAYAALTIPDVSVVNIDDDAPALLATGGPLVTDEAGGTDTFQIRLGGAPSADVIVPIAVDLPAEVSVSPSVLTFTPANYAVPQTVTVTGLDDTDIDGDMAFVVWVGPASSSDPGYDGLSGPDVPGTNRDDESPGVRLDPQHDLLVDESGATDTVAVRLSTQPTADVILTLAVSDETEVALDLDELVFTAADWSVPQTVTLTGLDDEEIDGDMPWTVEVTEIVSDDPAYDDLATLGDLDAEGTTLDDDGPGYLVSPLSGLFTSEDGGEDSFTVVLRTAPSADVFVVINSSDPSEGVPTPSVLSFTPADWSIAQVVTVAGVDDADEDGDIAYRILLDATTADPGYESIDPPDVSVINLDDEGLDTTPTETGDTGTPPDTDTTPGTDTDTDPGPGETDGTGDGKDEGGGCGCASSGSPLGSLAGLLGLIALAARRRAA